MIVKMAHKANGSLNLPILTFFNKSKTGLLIRDKTPASKMQITILEKYQSTKHSIENKTKYNNHLGKTFICVYLNYIHKINEISCFHIVFSFSRSPGC